MDGDDPPCPLHSELLEEGDGHDTLVCKEPVGVEEGTT
jgi:hypothetical protein